MSTRNKAKRINEKYKVSDEPSNSQTSNESLRAKKVPLSLTELVQTATLPIKIKSEIASSDNDQTNIYLKIIFLTEEIHTVNKRPAVLIPCDPDTDNLIGIMVSNMGPLYPATGCKLDGRPANGEMFPGIQNLINPNDFTNQFRFASTNWRADAIK